jgi:hypothetical protein
VRDNDCSQAIIRRVPGLFGASRSSRLVISSQRSIRAGAGTDRIVFSRVSQTENYE